MRREICFGTTVNSLGGGAYIAHRRRHFMHSVLRCSPPSDIRVVIDVQGQSGMQLRRLLRDSNRQADLPRRSVGSYQGMLEEGDGIARQRP